MVHFVYGDSARWLAVWDARSRGLPLASVFWRLTRMGVKGVWICLTLVLRMAGEWVRGLIDARLGRVSEAKT